MITLYPFQLSASDQIADRVASAVIQPTVATARGVSRRVPFVQLLNSITASGKTVIMADAVASIAKQVTVPPVILWLSKATVVVEQTYANLDEGGAYHNLLDDFQVRWLAEYDQSEVAEVVRPFLFFATVGLINQKDKEKGDRRVFQSAIDDAASSTWDALKTRPTPGGLRRPLVVVYDEAHNLSVQQTDILLDLDPDAFILATATQRLPRRFTDEVVDVLKSVGQFGDADLVTAVNAREVAESGLIKQGLDLIGRQAPMEQVLSEMLAALADAELDAAAYGMEGRPKAVYVCKTNIVEGSDETDNHRQPFNQRQAPPILIWRQLVEVHGIDPSQVAVYANLKVDRSYPLPAEFVLFGGGEKDYSEFTRGEFRHVIFNQSLQEGWDDPLVYFAYIDKSMGSRVQAEQVVGRLLRQPGQKHYPAARLNKADIYVRVEATGVFDEVVESVEKKITADGIQIEIAKTAPGSKARTELPVKKDLTVPRIAVVTDEAAPVIAEFIRRMNDYRNDRDNVVGVGRIARVQKLVGEGASQGFVWEERGESAVVLARWLFAREVRRTHQGALGLAVTSNADGTSSKFDARVGLGSNAAANIADVAARVAKAYIDGVDLKVTRPNPYRVGPCLADPAAVTPFTNAGHSGYSGLNGFEDRVARALDRTGLDWVRNPAQTGYFIPLVEAGRTNNFYPDFLVWKDGDVYAIETKAAVLLSDALRKLVNIKPGGDGVPRVFIRFLLEGEVGEDGPKPDSSGYTLLHVRSDTRRTYQHQSSLDGLVTRALTPSAS